MTTTVSTGSSNLTDTKAAADAATRRALERLGGRAAHFGFLFAAPDRDLSACLAAAADVVGGAHLIACTTAGEITEQGLTHGGVAVLLVASDAMEVAPAFADDLKANPVGAARQLAAALEHVRRAAAGRNRRQLTSVVLTDGLSGTGERLVTQLFDDGSGARQIVGGAAGDEGKFEATWVGAGGRVARDSVAALHVFGEHAWGVGVHHGLRPTTKPMRVTRAVDNVIHEIEGEPAFKAYVRHAADRGVTLTGADAGPYLIANELGIHFFDKVVRARAPLSVGADGSLTCAADVPRGSMVSILDGEPDVMIAAARSAAEEAKTHLGGRPAAGVLLFDCVCRGMILKDGFRREIDAVRHVFGDVPVAGFLTYGEIARYQGQLDGWHNATAVVVAIPA